MKKTKIIASLGPACFNPDILEQMAYAGMNCVRINFSHATEKQNETTLKIIDEVRKRTKKNIAILYDTKGPEFRNDTLENGEINLIEGNKIRVIKEHILGNDKAFSVNHPAALNSVEKGNYILLENGLMKLKVISKEEDGVTCEVINGGVLGDKKSINVPGVHLNIPFISKQDRNDIIYASHHDGDFLAASFVSCKEDIYEIKEILKEEKSNMKIISKIENTTAIKNIEEIIEVSDGIMIARGDLGVEARMEDLPHYQKEIIRLCRKHSTFVIVATEMLESMKTSLRPTRAEITDVANAILDGTDAVMLSGETTVGKYPVEVVKIMANICEAQESHANFDRKYDFDRGNNIAEMIATSVVNSANELNAKLIIASTLSGYTARKISNMKPNCIILATCHDKKIAKSLNLYYGVETKTIPLYESTDEIIETSIKAAKEKFNLKENDIIVITGGFSKEKMEKHTTNLMKIEKIA